MKAYTEDELREDIRSRSVATLYAENQRLRAALEEVKDCLLWNPDDSKQLLITWIRDAQDAVNRALSEGGEA